jgi:D-sedoheptulose 7-phosphate isomerase
MARNSRLYGAFWYDLVRSFRTEYSVRDRFNRLLTEHVQVAEETRGVCFPQLERAADLVAEALSTGGKVLFFGNGGSAADAQHLAAELTVRFVAQRRAFAGLALTTDTSVLTACANDFGFESLFSRQIEALGRPGDVAICFSTSGNSPNVLSGMRQARESGIATVAFTGRSGGKLAGQSDVLIAIPSESTARIQEMHIVLGHILCEEIEARLVARE